MVNVTRTTKSQTRLSFLLWDRRPSRCARADTTGSFLSFPNNMALYLELGVVGFAFLKSFHDGRLVHRHGVPIFCPSRNIFKCLYLYICCNYSNSRHSSM